ncbi:hypothetical protein BAC3_01713 [uncultured bacterium]|nr:hypothetical protein BAC3_01713 [uncultured bacterium]
MRVLLSYMNKNDDCYFYKGKPFSGVGFEIDNDKNVTAYEMEQGKIIKPYQSAYKINGQEFNQVDITAGITDYRETASFENRSYSGIGFEFKDDFCVAEILVINSIIWWQSQWDSKGILRRFDVPSPFFAEFYNWFPNGKIESIGIRWDRTGGFKYNGSIRFQEDEVIVDFTAESDFLKFFNEVHIMARFFPYVESKDLCKARWSEKVRLLGDDINDDFINMMIESGSWDHVTELTLANTNIENPVFNKLKNIRELCLDGGNKQIHEAIAQQLKQERPDISIYIDRFRYDTSR